MPNLIILELEFKNKIVIFEISPSLTPQIGEIAKLREAIKMSKFGTKYALFGYFSG